MRFVNPMSAEEGAKKSVTLDGICKSAASASRTVARPRSSRAVLVFPTARAIRLRTCSSRAATPFSSCACPAAS